MDQEAKNKVQARFSSICDRKISSKSEREVYKMVVRFVAIDGLELVTELKMGMTRMDRIRHEYVRG